MAKMTLGALALVASTALGGAAMAGTAYDYAFEKIEGGALPMSQFKGKAVLVVNTASFCGYTYQYEGLEALWKSYKDKGLVVVGVPANNFGGQEPGSNAEIQTFCTAKYDVDFPMAAKVSVAGSDAHPFYKWAKDTLGDSKAPKWNFHKYLVGADGALVGAFPSGVEPSSKELTGAIDKVLAK